MTSVDRLPTPPDEAPARTRWGLVVTAIGAGFVAAFQVGKAAIAAPLLQADLQLSLVAASWIVGAYGTLGAAIGLLAGLAVGRIGTRTAAVLGLALIGIAGTLGAFASTGPALFASRAAEGCGFLAITIAVPSLLRSLAAESDRDLVLALWSTYMPAGTAIMMLAAPLIAEQGWRALWVANGILAMAYAALLLLTIRAMPGAKSATPATLSQDLRATFAARGPLLLALAFGTYTLQYFAITALLPTLLVQRLGLSIALAGTLSAIAVIGNALGNLAAGVLFRSGVPIWATILVAFLSLALTSLGIFNGALPATAVAACAFLSLTLTGLVPASILAAAPRLSASIGALPVTMGLVMQASNLGQLLGPAALGAFVDRIGWESAPVLFVVLAATGAILALSIRPLLRAAR